MGDGCPRISPSLITSTGNTLRIPNLFRNQICSPGLILPPSNIQLSQERVQRFLLRTKFLTSAGVRRLQSSEKPLQNEKRTFLGIWFRRRGDKDRGVFDPVGGELDEGDGAEDEGRSGQGGEIAVERCYRLQSMSAAVRLGQGGLFG